MRTTQEIAASMDDAAARVIATDRSILGQGVSEIAARYRCSPEVARAALALARRAEADRTAAYWAEAGARETPEWRRPY